jgi:hypothetical protein
MRSKILITVVAVCFAAGVAQPLRAQGSSKIARPTATSGTRLGLAPDPAEQVATGQYSPQTLEDLRGELLNLADSVLEFSELAPAELVDADSLRQARGQIQQMSTQYLNVLRKGIDPSKLHGRLVRARAAVAEYSKVKLGAKTTSGVRPLTAGFPNANGFCTSANGSDVNRIPTAVVLAADVVFFIADGVREFAQDACKQEAVVLGEGGNTSLACIIVDTVWIVAKAVDEGIHFCDDDLTGAVVDGNYARLDHIHNDLADVQTGVNNVSTQVTNVSTQVTNVDTHVSNVDAHIGLEFVALDAHIVTLVNQLSTQMAQDTALLSADLKQIMKLELTPEGLRKIVPAILTCTGTNCPNVLANCPGTGCAWNNVGPLP